MAIENNILDAVKTVAQSEVSKVKYDRTIVAEIIGAVENTSNRYWVSNGAVRFQATAIGDYGSYVEGQKVYVVIPNDDYGNENKTIIGSYEAEDGYQINFSTDPFDDMVVARTFTPDIVLAISTNRTIKEGEALKSSEIVASKIENLFFPYTPKIPLDYLGIEFEINTYDKGRVINYFSQGEYLITIQFGSSVYTISSNEILGNPFNLVSNTKNKKLFNLVSFKDLPNKNNSSTSIAKINLKFISLKNDDNQNLTVKLSSLRFLFGYKKSSLKENSLNLYNLLDDTWDYDYSVDDSPNKGRTFLLGEYIDADNKKILTAAFSPNDEILIDEGQQITPTELYKSQPFDWSYTGILKFFYEKDGKQYFKGPYGLETNNDTVFFIKIFQYISGLQQTDDQNAGIFWKQLGTTGINFLESEINWNITWEKFSKDQILGKNSTLLFSNTLLPESSEDSFKIGMYLITQEKFESLVKTIKFLIENAKIEDNEKEAVFKEQLKNALEKECKYIESPIVGMLNLQPYVPPDDPDPEPEPEEPDIDNTGATNNTDTGLRLIPPDNGFYYYYNSLGNIIKKEELYKNRTIIVELISGKKYVVNSKEKDISKGIFASEEELKKYIKVEWDFPEQNTMLTKQGDNWTVSSSGQNKIYTPTLTYQINDYYLPGLKENNTIKCTIKDYTKCAPKSDNPDEFDETNIQIFRGSFSCRFGEVSSSGSNYNFYVYFEDKNIYGINVHSEKVINREGYNIRCQIEGTNGVPLTKEAKKNIYENCLDFDTYPVIGKSDEAKQEIPIAFEWKDGNFYNDSNVNTDGSYSLGRVYVDNGFQDSKNNQYTLLDCMINTSVLQFTLKDILISNGMTTNISAYLPIPLYQVGNVNGFTGDIPLVLNGPTIITYNTNNDNLKDYLDTPYEIYNTSSGTKYEIFNNKGETQGFSHLVTQIWDPSINGINPNSIQLISASSNYTAADFKGYKDYYGEKVYYTHNIDISPDINFNAPLSEDLQVFENKNGEFHLQLPASFNLQRKPAIRCLRITFKIGEEIIGLWEQPILIKSETWELPVLNDWTGDFTINKKENYLLTATVAAGIKDTDNTFSGVVMGTIFNDYSFEKGLYGFDKGVCNFYLTNNGSYYVGNGTSYLSFNDSAHFSENGGLSLQLGENGKLIVGNGTLAFNDETGAFDKDSSSANSYLVFDSKNLYLKVSGDLSFTSTNFSLESSNIKINNSLGVQVLKSGGFSILSDFKSYDGDESLVQQNAFEVTNQGDISLIGGIIEYTPGQSLTPRARLDFRCNNDQGNQLEVFKNQSVSAISYSELAEKLNVNISALTRYKNARDKLVKLFKEKTFKRQSISFTNYELPVGTFCISNNKNSSGSYDLTYCPYKTTDFSKTTGTVSPNPYEVSYLKDWLTIMPCFERVERTTTGDENSYTYFAGTTIIGKETLRLGYSYFDETAKDYRWDYESVNISTHSIATNNIIDTKNNGIVVTSDISQKNSIVSLPNSYSSFFDDLQPKIFKYNNGTSGRFHLGFIAQEVEQGLINNNINVDEFAGLCQNTENKLWSIRYDEFIALNTWQIQKLKKRVAELEQEIKEIKQ